MKKIFKMIKKKKQDSKDFKDAQDTPKYNDAMDKADKNVPKSKKGNKIGTMIGASAGAYIGNKVSKQKNKGFDDHPLHGTKGFEKGTKGGDVTSGTPDTDVFGKTGKGIIKTAYTGVGGLVGNRIQDTAKKKIRNYKVKKKAKKIFLEDRDKAKK